MERSEELGISFRSRDKTVKGRKGKNGTLKMTPGFFLFEQLSGLTEED